MSPNEPSARAAATLVYKGLQPKLVVSKDKEYRELLTRYESNSAWRSMVQDIAIGMGLQTLAVNPEGAFFAPASNKSRFAMRLQDIRLGMAPEEKAIMVLTHVAVAALFYPTAERLNDDSYTPPAVDEAETLSLLKTLCARLAAQTDAQRQDVPKELSRARCVCLASRNRVPNKRTAPSEPWKASLRRSSSSCPTTVSSFRSRARNRCATWQPGSTRFSCAN